MNDDLSDIGSLLYGDRWQAAMARRLNVSRRTIVNWSSGIGAPSDEHMAELLRALEAHASQIGRMIKRMKVVPRVRL